MTLESTGAVSNVFWRRRACTSTRRPAMASGRCGSPSRVTWWPCTIAATAWRSMTECASSGRGELGDVTRWLVLEKGLAWADDLVVIGERRDSVLVLDFDERGARAGGGVLEAGSDDLEALERVATDVVGYLATRLGLPEARAIRGPLPK